HRSRKPYRLLLSAQLPRLFRRGADAEYQCMPRAVTQGVDRMMRALPAMAGLGALLHESSQNVLQAAELPPPQPQGPVSARGENCGPCGCLQVTYDYHRELRSTYGRDYDPRNFDTTEPQFYFGPVRAYPRYFVDGVPLH